MQLDLDQLRELLASLNQTDISELNLKGENFELVVRRGSEHPASQSVSPIPPSSVAAVPLPAIAPPQAASPIAAVQPAPPSPTLLEPTAPPQRGTDWLEIKSPMVGTFYRAPAPGEADFVAIGDKIKPGQTVCILEAMKLMNELEAEIAGEVIEILVENGQPVEFDQPLIRVKPGL